MSERTIEIHRKAFLHLIRHWCEQVKPLAHCHEVPEELNMNILASVRLCSTKLAGTGSGFAYLDLEKLRLECCRLDSLGWYSLYFELLSKSLPTPENDEVVTSIGRCRRMQPFWKRIVPLISHHNSECRYFLLQMLWACKNLDDGLTSITCALYKNVSDTLMYVDESVALLFARVGNRLVEDGGTLTMNPDFQDQFRTRIEDAARSGPTAYTKTFAGFDDMISKRIAWAYKCIGRNADYVEQLEREDFIGAQYERFVLMLWKNRRSEYDGRILFAIGKQEEEEYDYRPYDARPGIEMVREAACRGLPDAQLFMAERCLDEGAYIAAAEYAYPIRENKRAAAILCECFAECGPGELDYLKWTELNADVRREPDSKKCLAADLDDRGCIVQGDCGIKCNGEWQVGEHGREHGDFWCQYDGRWTQCPMYCGAVYRGYEPRTTYCGSLL